MPRPTVPSKRPADTQEAAWIADEDRFVLRQAKTKAAMRVKGERAQPVDWLAVALAVVDTDRNPLDEDVDDDVIGQVDPVTVFEKLDEAQLTDLERGIDTYLTLESSKSNRDYWDVMKTICRDRRQHSQSNRPTARGVTSVASDLDSLLGPKTLSELEKLERQIKTKLESNEPIDTDYWEHLLKSLLTYKAKAKLSKISQSIRDARLKELRKQQAAEAVAFKLRLAARLPDASGNKQSVREDGSEHEVGENLRHSLDPNPMLRLRQEDKSLDLFTEHEYMLKIAENRRRVLRLGYVPQRLLQNEVSGTQEPAAKRMRIDGEDAAQTSTSLFDREAARGFRDNEELFAVEEEVITSNKPKWAHQYRPRKPRYFNRVQMGYEWNKYNQTHYDHDHPPPKVVQGYKFNVFYPDLVEKTKAPTYKIERENGRKRGQTLAPAGENDTCLIRFVAGPPYEDIAFRIVDREWDYSAKRERGFRSSFDKGILQLHFQFKKIYYRK